MSLAEAQNTSSLRLRHAGFYEFRRGNGRQYVIGVNIDARESDLTRIPEETLALLRRGPAPPGGAAASAPATAALQPYPLWWFIMVAALVAALGQAWLGDRLLRTTMREPQ